MRVSTQGVHQAALLGLMQAQRNVFEANQQVNTGLKAPDLKGYGHAAESILTGKGAIQRTEAQVQSNQRLANRLEVQDIALERISGAVTSLREAMTTNDASFLMLEVETAFEVISDALNTSYQGGYIFAGTRTDTAPFNARSLADVQGAGDIADLFDNGPRRQSYKIEENTTIETGALADSVGAQIMGVLQRLADFNAGADGPFDGSTTQAQQDFLTTEIENLIAAFDTVNVAQAQNGVQQKRVEQAITTGEARVDFYTRVVAGEEEVDMAEAVSRLTRADIAVQIAAATFTNLTQVSLLPFLR